MAMNKLSNIGDVFNVAKQNQLSDGTVVKEGPHYYAFKNPKDLSTECRIHIPGFNMREWVTRRTAAETNKLPEFMGSSSIILGSSGCGKTIFSTKLISNFIRYNQSERIAIILCAQTKSAYDRLIAANDVASTPFLVKEQICYLSKLELVIDIFKRLADMAAQNDEAAPASCAWTEAVEHIEDESEKKVIVAYKAKERHKIATIFNNYTHFVFYFDDCNQYYKDPKARPFWDLLSSQNRHAGVTVIYNMQDISYVPQSIRTNISNLFLLGNAQQRLVHKHLSSMFPQPYGSSEKKFVQFQHQLHKLFPAKQTILVFSAFYVSIPKIFVYRVNKNFVDSLLAKELELSSARERRRAARLVDSKINQKN